MSLSSRDMMMSQNFNTYGSGDQNIFSIATLWNRVYFFVVKDSFSQMIIVVGETKSAKK